VPREELDWPAPVGSAVFSQGCVLNRSEYLARRSPEHAGVEEVKNATFRSLVQEDEECVFLKRDRAVSL
jgi:hypothetical protein